jgi:predicted CoA-binding protein
MRSNLDTIHRFLACKRIAIVGISRNSAELSVNLFQEFLRRGYEVVPVNPHLGDVLGHKCYARVQDVQPPVEAALLTTPPKVTESVVRDCAEAGIGLIWMLRATGRGAVSEKGVEFCRERGIQVVAGECPFMFLPGAAAFHRFHALIRKLTGSYPEKGRNAA